VEWIRLLPLAKSLGGVGVGARVGVGVWGCLWG